MNLNNLEEKLNNIKYELNNNNLNKIIKNLYNSNIENPIDDINIKQEYYSTLNGSEKLSVYAVHTYATSSLFNGVV